MIFKKCISPVAFHVYWVYRATFHSLYVLSVNEVHLLVVKFVFFKYENYLFYL